MAEGKSYILDLNVLRHGDIILKRSSNDLSKKIREWTHSDYSHAMLYVGDGVIIHSDGMGVSSLNAQRQGVEHEDDMVVLRVKEGLHYNAMTLETYARRMIGMAYDMQEARQVLNKKRDIDGNTSNRQFCTKFVAMAYAEAGLKIVEEPTLCTAQDVLSSEKLELVKNAVRKATVAEQELVDEENPIAKQQEAATQDLLQQIRVKSSQDIQTLEQLWEICEADKQVDEIAYEVCANHVYFNVLDEYHKLHPEEYDALMFISHYGTKEYTEYAAQTLWDTMQKLYAFFLITYLRLKQMYEQSHSKTIERFMYFHQSLIEDCHNRMAVFKIFL